MSRILYNTLQGYGWSLEFARNLLANESRGEGANKIEHQINARIYNNALCGLLKNGYKYEIVEENGGKHVRLCMDGQYYQCPINTVKNIFREEYGDIISEAAIKEEESVKAPVVDEAPVEVKVITSQEKEPASEKESESEKTESAITDKPENQSDLSVQNVKDDNALPMTPEVRMPALLKVSVDENNFPKEIDNQTVIDDSEKRKSPTQNPLFQHRVPNLDEFTFMPVKEKNIVDITEINREPSTVELDATEITETEAKDTPLKEEKSSSDNAAAPDSTEALSVEKEDTESVEVIDSKSADEKSPEPETAKVNDAAEIIPINDVAEKPVMEKAGVQPAVILAQVTEELQTDKEASEIVDAILIKKDTMDASEESNILSEVMKDVNMSTEASLSEEVPAINNKESMDPSKTNPHHTGKETIVPKAAEGMKFKPKAVAQTKSTPTAPVSIADEPKIKKGLRSFFGGDKKKNAESEVKLPALEDVSESMQSSERETEGHTEELQPKAVTTAIPSDVSASKALIPEKPAEISYAHNGGELFKHIHQVVLKKSFGSDSIGPYRIFFWPTTIPEVTSGKNWADILVHITEPSGNEIVACTDGNYKELSLSLGKKEINVFGTWNNGIFESHVTLRGKTASMFTIEEDVYREVPEDIMHDDFLNQFRFEKRGQPKHFIVPFKNNNRGELSIPIIGYVELSEKKYILERREGNTLRYRYNGNDKVVKGHWENEKFTFAIEDAVRFVWEEGDSVDDE